MPPQPVNRKKIKKAVGKIWKQSLIAMLKEKPNVDKWGYKEAKILFIATSYLGEAATDRLLEKYLEA